MPQTKLSTPNILLILTDQHRWDALSCAVAPGQGPRTPHLDALAGRGVRFTHAFAASVACSPSRASLFTGVYPHVHGVTMNNLVINDGLPNLATQLGDTYNLRYAGKWHADHGRMPSEYGFQGKDFPGYGFPTADGTIEGMWFHRETVASGVSTVTPHYANYLDVHGLPRPKVLEARYGVHSSRHEIAGLLSGDIESTFEAMVASDTIDHLEAYGASAQEQPFFLWANFWGPHTPCVIPEPYFSMYDPRTIEPDPSFLETWEHKPHRLKLAERRWGLSGEGWEGWREIVARYWGYVTLLDDLVGRMLDSLAAQGMADNTVVVFSSDHGDMMGSHRLIEKGAFAYDEAYRVPMIAAHPNCATPGATVDDLVLMHDLYPTVLDLAGAEIPANCQFTSLADTVLDAGQSQPQESVFCYSKHGIAHGIRMVRTATAKIAFAPTEFGGLDTVNDPWEVAELYDLAADPYETRNLMGLAEHRDLQDEMVALMREKLIQVGEPIIDYWDAVSQAWATGSWKAGGPPEE
jgi:arylsulfatase A-like enzyme